MGAGNSVIDMKLWSINYTTTTVINNNLIREIMNDLINEVILEREENKYILSPIWSSKEKDNDK